MPVPAKSATSIAPSCNANDTTRIYRMNKTMAAGDSPPPLSWVAAISRSGRTGVRARQPTRAGRGVIAMSCGTT